MKSRIKSVFFGLIAVLLLAGTSNALDYDFSGNLTNHNDVLRYSFTTNGTSTVTLFSSSWDDGNFDPMLGLWRSDGSSILWQDDGGRVGTTLSNGVAYDHGRWDSYYSQLLDAGTYFVTLMTYYNRPLGNNLSDGFIYDSEAPISMTSWNQPANGNRGDYYAFHILGVQGAHDASAVPEPSTLLLLCCGLISLAFYGRRRMRV